MCSFMFSQVSSVRAESVVIVVNCDRCGARCGYCDLRLAADAIRVAVW